MARAQFDGFAIHRIVEVARVLAVDRDERHVAQVDAVLEISLADHVRQARGLLAGGFRKLDGHVELAHRDLDFHAGIVDLAQDLGHTAQRLRVAGRLLHDFHRDHLPMLGAIGVAGRNQDVVLDALVFGHDDGQPVLMQEAPHQFIGAAFDDLHDGAFRLASVFARGLHQHAIAVQHLEHFARRQEQVGPAVVAQQKAEAVAMTQHLAGDEVQFGGEQQHALAIGHQLPVALHRAQPALEPHHRCRALDAHALGQLHRRQRRARGTQRFQDGFTRRYIRVEVRRRFGQGC
ncbi:hypothetical protein FQZ97_516800 [compost metagenome]